MIDTDNYEASGIKIITFPGGEFHADVPEFPTNELNIFAKIRSWEDMGKLIFVNDALTERGYIVHLFMPYLPGARQDRSQDGFAFSAALYGSLFSSFATVTCVDPHSLAAVEQYERYRDVEHHRYSQLLHVIPPTEYLDRLVPKNMYSAVIAPDKGSVDRANEVARLLGLNLVIQCEKRRDPKTGNLSGFDVVSHDLKSREMQIKLDGSHVLIADDICDGGWTFIGISDAIHRQNARIRLDLLVTHGIFSKGLVELSARFGTIYTTNSWCTLEPSDKLKVLDLLPVYQERLTP